MALFDAAAMAAVDILASVYGDAGVYTRPPAAPIPCRIIRGRSDDSIAFGSNETSVRAPGWYAEITKAEVAVRPRKDKDTVTIGLITYRIRDVQEDVERASWKLDIIEV